MFLEIVKRETQKSEEWNSHFTTSQLLNSPCELDFGSRGFVFGSQTTILRRFGQRFPKRRQTYTVVCSQPQIGEEKDGKNTRSEGRLVHLMSTTPYCTRPCGNLSVRIQDLFLHTQRSVLSPNRWWRSAFQKDDGWLILLDSPGEEEGGNEEERKASHPSLATQTCLVAGTARIKFTIGTCISYHGKFIENLFWYSTV